MMRNEVVNYINLQNKYKIQIIAAVKINNVSNNYYCAHRILYLSFSYQINCIF